MAFARHSHPSFVSTSSEAEQLGGVLYSTAPCGGDCDGVHGEGVNHVTGAPSESQGYRALLEHKPRHGAVPRPLPFPCSRGPQADGALCSP